MKVFRCGFRAHFASEQDVANTNFVAGGRMLRLSDIAQIRRDYSDPPQPQFRVNGEPAIGLAIAMRDGGDILALGENIKQLMARATADLPIGIEPKLIADQAVTVDGAISEFMTSLLQAIAIILVVSFISLGVRPGLIIALSIPLTLAVVFSDHANGQHRYAAHLPRRADHRPRIARRRRDDDDRCHAQSAGGRATTRSRPRHSRSGPTHLPCSRERW